MSLRRTPASSVKCPLSPYSLVIAMVLAVGCARHDPDTFVAHLGPVSGSIAATDVQTIVPAHARAPSLDTRKPSDPTNLKQLLAEGFGELTIGPGETPIERTLDGKPPPAA